MPRFTIHDGQKLAERTALICRVLIGEEKCYCAGGADASCVHCFTMAQVKQVVQDTLSRAALEARNFEAWIYHEGDEVAKEAGANCSVINELPSMERLAVDILELKIGE